MDDLSIFGHWLQLGFLSFIDTLAQTSPSTTLCDLPTAYYSREKLVRSSPSSSSSSRRRKVRPSLMPTAAPSCFAAALLMEKSFFLQEGRGRD
jgi:hypothetical protein